MSAQLTQDEIDRLFREHGGPDGAGAAAERAVQYDFRRPDRIPKEQLRSIHLMHDFLARNLASSLGAYLRAYVSVSLVSVEQLSFGEFLQYLPAPTCVSSISMAPMDGNSVLEINPSLVLPMLDILLGGGGNVNPDDTRELTEIEQSIAESILRVVLHDLREAWAPVMEIEFAFDGMETQPQLVQVLSANEAVVAIGFEITLGEARGMMNFGLPSILVKMIGQKFEQQWSLRRRSASPEERRLMEPLLGRAPVKLEARVRGMGLSVRRAIELEVGDVLSLGVPVKRPADISVNGVNKFEGELVATGSVRGVRVRSDSGGEAAT